MTRTQCIDIIARALVSRGGPHDDLWENYPDISETDWMDIIARAHQIRHDLTPTNPSLHAAYQVLTDLANTPEN